MTTMQLMELFKLPQSKFYKMRVAGIIPAPVGGATMRKHYTTKQVEAIAKTLTKLGEIRA